MKNLILSMALFTCTCSFFNTLNAEDKSSMNSNRPTIVMETSQGNIEILLYPDVAPKTVENFLTHIENHYYDGLTFHRVIPNFMIQGGDPNGNGTGGKSIWGKPFADEFDKKVRFDKKGLLAMANAGPNTNGSQFFITTAPTSWLNDKHTIFGEVTKGYDVVEKIEKAPASPANNRPLTEQKIIKIYVKK